MARPTTNPRNPPRPCPEGCPMDAAHSCAHCSPTWRCATCSWPLVVNPDGGNRVCLHCQGMVLTPGEWDEVAETGCAPQARRAPGPTAADGALDDATLKVTTALVTARHKHALAAMALDAARAAHNDAIKALRDAEAALLDHFDLQSDDR